MVLSPQTIIVSIGHSINALICVALAMLVLGQAPRLRSNQLFALMMLCLSAYSALNVFGRFLQPLQIEPKPVYELTLVLYLVFVTLLFFFAADFARLRGRAANLVKGLGVAANGLSIPAVFNEQFFREIYPLPDGSGGYNYTPGPLFVPVALVHLLYLFLIIAVLYRSGEPRARLLWPAVALIMGGVAALALRPLLPLPLNAVFLALAALWMGYVVLRHQLFNPLAALNRELAATNKQLAAANAQLAEASHLKGLFLTRMSHELRTPLNSIIGYTELVLEGQYGPVNQSQQDRLQRVIRNARHLLGLINDILDLSKIEAGRLTLEVAELDTRALLESVLATVEPQASEKGLRIHRRFQDAPPIQGDETRIRQIFLNLLSNAIKFTTEGSITIQADPRPTDGLAHFQISDTGIGIPNSKLDLIFEEFRQLDESSTREFPGSGLGLTITRHLAELHGGRVWAESQVGVGTTFHLLLPAVEAQPPSGAQMAGPGEAKARRPRLILAIAADTATLAAFRSQLASDGYRVVGARSEPQALEQARRLHPDLILLDMVTPGMDGWQMLKALKADPFTTHIPIILVGVVDEEPRALSMGASDMVVKPVDRALLLDAVQRTLSQTDRPPAPILVVDDNETDRMLLKEILSNAGYAVEAVDSGQAACVWLARHRASLVLLDLIMPEMSGFDVLQFIRESQTLADLPVLVVTAKDLSPQEEQLLRRQYAALVEKGDLAQGYLLAEVKESLKRYE